jgi:hypothetical protein
LSCWAHQTKGARAFARTPLFSLLNVTRCARDYGSMQTFVLTGEVNASPSAFTPTA